MNNKINTRDISCINTPPDRLYTTYYQDYFTISRYFKCVSFLAESSRIAKLLFAFLSSSYPISKVFLFRWRKFVLIFGNRGEFSRQMSPFPNRRPLFASATGAHFRGNLEEGPHATCRFCNDSTFASGSQQWLVTCRSSRIAISSSHWRTKRHRIDIARKNT